MIAYKACIIDNKDGTFDVLIDERVEKTSAATKLLTEGKVRDVSQMISGSLTLSHGPDKEEIVIERICGDWYIKSEDGFWWIAKNLMWIKSYVNEPIGAMQFKTKEEAEEVLKNMG